MRLSVTLTSLAAGAAIACLAAALVPQPASAEDARPDGAPPCMCPDPSKPSSLWAKPEYARPTAGLDENDEIAALEAIRVALTEVGDGSTYVWRRQHGRLSGIVRPTISFKDAAGRVCRHILLIMTVGTATGKAEGIACRLANGRWQLDG
jgi:hypothetical protein